jgi:hypothetical protein
MYVPDTILVLKEQRPDGPDGPFPYNRVRVVNQSPINHAESSEWTGANGQGVIVQPAGDGFGTNLDEPYGKLVELYDVESIPAPAELTAPVIRVMKPNDLGPSPEEVFARAAEAEGDTGNRRTKPKPRVQSPLPKAEPPKTAESPL